MTARLHHVAVTVTDMDASIAWYNDLFGFVELAREEHFGGSGGYAVVLGPPDWSMAVVLNHHPTNGGMFDPTRTGLDHIGFVMPDRAAIEEWEARLSDKGIKHSPISDHDWGSSLNFRDPDDMQLQLVAFAAM